MIKLGENSKEVVSAVGLSHEEAIRQEVRRDVEERYKSDDNPVTKFLMRAGVLEDMEVLRRCIMESKSNKEIFLYNNKLAGLKAYISVVKDSYAVREKQAKISATEREADADADGVTVVMNR